MERHRGDYDMGQIKKFALLAALLPSVAMAQGLRAGVAVQLKCTSAAPTKVAANGEVWCDSTAGNTLKYTTPAGVTSSLAGSSTLATVYDVATPANNKITLVNAGGGVIIKDNGTPISGGMFQVQDNGAFPLLYVSTETAAGTGNTNISLAGSVDISARGNGNIAPSLVVGDAARSTNLTASTEINDLQYGGVTWTWAAGAITSQRFVRIKRNTIAFASASTVGDAASIYFDGAVQPGANATLTRTWTGWSGQGAWRFDQNAVGTTIGQLGILSINTSTATAGAQQYSPTIALEGQGWKTNATAASQTVRYELQTIPIQGAAAPTGELRISESIAGGAETTLLQIGSSAITASKPIVGNLGSTTIAPSWTSVTYQNSYVDYGLGGYAGSAYYKDANGIVHVRVAAKSGTATAAIFTLPAGYRPGGTRVVTAAVDGTFHNVTVSTAGVVQTDVGGNTFAICFIDFPAEN